ncbi:MAG: TIGR03759 family integrating conjugative element protein [Cellvibrionales bacterium]|nr:MAG: TIGR03759 family integrating conjugative element protein [Cellvibrionales bacterium]
MKVSNQFVSVIVLLIGIVALVSVSYSDTAEHSKTTPQTPVRETPVTQTQIIQQDAARWALDISEYQRYLDLIRGPLGKWNPTIDPLMALGMFADTEQQSQRYAERYARQEFELTERVLRFQTAYRAAFNRLYPNVGVLDQRLLAPYYAHQQQKSASKAAKNIAQRRFVEGDRLLVFVADSCKECFTTIRRLMSLLSGLKNSGVDIYVRDAKDDSAVSRWAKEQGIQTEWLNKQTLTLNRDEGLYHRLQSRSSNVNHATFPVFLKRNQQFFQLKAEDLGL